MRKAKRKRKEKKKKKEIPDCRSEQRAGPNTNTNTNNSGGTEYRYSVHQMIVEQGDRDVQEKDRFLFPMRRGGTEVEGLAE